MTKQFSNYSDLLTFTRASKGHALRPVSYGAELVTNGTFDSDTSGWTANQATISSESGRLKVVDSGAFSGAKQAISTKAGSVYVIQFDYDNNAVGVDNAYVALHNGDKTSTTITTGSNGDVLPFDDSYDYISGNTGTASIPFVALGNTTTILIGSSSYYTAYHDNVSVKEVLFDQPDGTLTLFEHPVNVPRVEWDSAGNRLGLLVEESRTNLITYSEDFSGAGWIGKTDISILDNAVTSPTGNSNATLITSSGIDPHTFDAVAVTSGNDYVFTVWLKGVGDTIGKTPNVRMLNNSGSVSPSVNDTTPLTSEWRRYTATGTCTVTGDILARIDFDDTGTSTSGDQFHVFGAQFEAGSFPTSYIKTTGSTATRSADVASIPVADFGYNKKASNILVDVKNIGDQTSSSVYLYDIAGNSGSNRIAAYITSSDGITFYTNDGGTSAAYGAGTATFDEMKLSVSFKDGSASSSLNGASVVTSTSVNYPEVSPTDFYIGSRFSSLEQLNGHIKSIKYYPRRLTDAQLQALTEPRSTPTLSLTFDGLESSYTENYIHG